MEREQNFLTYSARIDQHLTTTVVPSITCLYIGHSLLKKLNMWVVEVALLT